MFLFGHYWFSGRPPAGRAPEEESEWFRARKKECHYNYTISRRVIIGCRISLSDLFALYSPVLATNITCSDSVEIY